jgi:hypothetical protein
MILEEQLNESSPQSETTQREMIVPSVHENNTSNGSKNHMDNNNQEDGLFIAKVRRFITSNIPSLLSNLATQRRKMINIVEHSLMFFSLIFSLLAQLITRKWECAHTSHDVRFLFFLIKLLQLLLHPL